MATGPNIIAADPPVGRGTVPRNGVVIALLVIILGALTYFLLRDDPKPRAATPAAEAQLEHAARVQPPPNDAIVDATAERAKTEQMRAEQTAQAAKPAGTPPPASKTGASTAGGPVPTPIPRGVLIDGAGSGASLGSMDDERLRAAETAASIGGAAMIVVDRSVAPKEVPAESAPSGGKNFVAEKMAELAKLTGGASAGSPLAGLQQVAGTGDAGIADAVKALTQQNAAPNYNAQRAGWVKEISQEKHAGGIKPTGAAARWLVLQGTIIPAVLTREINSDLPGTITAIVSSDVYDSLRAQRLLIPRGTRVVGRYDSGVSAGQERLLFAFTRLIMPDGTNFDLPAAGGSDQAGRAGVTGDVNNHFFKQFGAALLVAIIGEKTTNRDTRGGSVVVSTGGTEGQVGQAFNEVTRSILDRYRHIPPTITIDAGTRLNIEVTQDMLFPDHWIAKRKAP